MSPITLTWEKLLASVLSIPGVWETPTQKKTMPKASAEAGKVLGMVGEIWTIVQVLRLLRATQYSIRVSVCLFRWIPAATRSNDIYLQVTFIRPFIAYQDSFLALQPSCVLSLSCSSYLFLGLVSFPQVSDGLPQITCCPMDGHSRGISIPFQVLRADWSISAFFPTENVGKYGQIRALKDLGLEGLSNSRLPKSVLHF